MMQAILWGAMGLFFLRVVAQLIQSVAPLSILPPFSQFHGNVLPYPALLASQAVILAFMFYVNLRVRSGWRPGFAAATGLRVFGVVYVAVMLFRLGAGLFGWIEHEWFHRPLPAFFHLVLASYVLALGMLPEQSGKELSR